MAWLESEITLWQRGRKLLRDTQMDKRGGLAGTAALLRQRKLEREEGRQHSNLPVRTGMQEQKQRRGGLAKIKLINEE
jgi:hypothetical protein